MVAGVVTVPRGRDVTVVFPEQSLHSFAPGGVGLLLENLGNVVGLIVLGGFGAGIRNVAGRIKILGDLEVFFPGVKTVVCLLWFFAVRREQRGLMFEEFVSIVLVQVG